MKHVFGPVPSRRLGRSLGVDPVPYKRCTYDCVYCQLGRTTHEPPEREDWIDPEEILGEIGDALRRHGDETDWICFTGRGEPTLCRSLGRLLRRTKAMTDRPVAVLTNGSLLWREDVRSDLAAADLVMPSLDAADPDTFARINRPSAGVDIETVVEGMVRFRESYGGLVWVEVMLVGGVNDREEPLLALRKALDRIRPDRIHLNTPIRPPAEEWVRPPDASGLVRAHAILQPAVLLEERECGRFAPGDEPSVESEVLSIVSRHPMRERQLREGLAGRSAEEIAEAVSQLERGGRVSRIPFRGDVFLVAAKGPAAVGRGDSRGGCRES